MNFPFDDGHWNYWEAWEVPPGSTHPPIIAGRAIDDILSMPDGNRKTCGTIIEQGTSLFYPNTELSNAFRPGRAVHAGILYSTYNGEAMVMGGTSTKIIPASDPRCNCHVDRRPTKDARTLQISFRWLLPRTLAGTDCMTVEGRKRWRMLSVGLGRYIVPHYSALLARQCRPRSQYALALTRRRSTSRS